MIKKILTASLFLSSILCLSACKEQVAYADAKELPPLKLPAGSLALSDRYDIPQIPNDNGKIITEVKPPDY